MYVILLKAFDGTDLSQTELTAEAKQDGVDFSRTQVVKYINDLVKWGLISSPQPSYEYKYGLTEKGKWCRKALDQIIPSRTATF